MQKIEEQLGKAKIAENDPTLKFTNKIQKILCRLRKEKKFTDRLFPNISIRSYTTAIVWYNKSP